MDAHDSPSTTQLEERLERLEQQNRRLRAGATLLTVGLAALATSAFRAAQRPQSRTLTARSLVLVDDVGAPQASIRWDGGQLRLEMPAAGAERSGPANPPSPSDSLHLPLGRIVVPPQRGPGVRLELARGTFGPSLILADGNGREVVRLGAPTARQLVK